MPTPIPVRLSTNPYNVIVGTGFLPRIGELMCVGLWSKWKAFDPGWAEEERAKHQAEAEAAGWEFGGEYRIEVPVEKQAAAFERIRHVSKSRRIVIVSDSNVAKLYGEVVRLSLESVGFETTLAIVPAGEQSKSLTALESVCDTMIAAGLDRSSLLLALGGGVVGDLAGFAASVYYRGIPYVQVPTTVVSQVDSSIGGKTGVNAKGGKNLIGAFHQPKLVLADVDALATLPSREYCEGFAEIIKHGVIRDAEMLDALGADPERLVARNVAIKARIVEEDEFETKDIRALLNFGHTIGHGIENAAGYGRYLHGEAISLGLAAALRLSVLKAGLPEQDQQKVRGLLREFHLPLKLDDAISTEAILEAMKKDKKFAQGHIRFVLTSKLGSAFVSKDVSAEDVRSAIEFLRRGD
jgi:3-dehydroquinate synthase